MTGWIRAAAKIIPVILSAVQAVERMSIKKGRDKQDEAVTLIGDLIPLVEASIGRDVIDDQAVQTALRLTIDAIAQMMNVVTEAKQRL